MEKLKPKIKIPSINPTLLPPFFENKKLTFDLETVAILESISQVVIEHQQPPSPISFFTLLLSLLKSEVGTQIEILSKDQGRKKKSSEEIVIEFCSEKRLNSLLWLFHEIMDHIPDFAAVLEKIFIDIVTPLIQLSGLLTLKSQTTYKNHLILCVGGILQVHVERQFWKREETIQLFKLLLFLTSYHNIENDTRHLASGKINQLATHAVGHGGHKNISGLIVMFCVSTLELNKTEGVNKQLAKKVEHMADFLGANFYLLTSKDVGRVAEALLIVGKTTPQWLGFILRAFLGLFPAGDLVRPVHKPKLLNQLIGALFEAQPNVLDVQHTRLFTQLICSALCSFFQMDRTHALLHQPQVFQILMPNLCSPRKEIYQNTCAWLRTVIERTIDAQEIQEALEHPENSLSKIILTLSMGLSYPYKEAWADLCGLYTRLITKLGASSSVLLSPLIQSVAELHGDPDILQPDFKKAAERTLGAAVTAVGPQRFLALVPLNLFHVDLRQNRAYLLPLMKKYICNTELSFFGQYFIPLAAELAKHMETAIENDRNHQAKNLEILHSQIWALFPSFCDNPPDISSTWGLIAQEVVAALDSDTTRLSVCKGIVNLVQSVTSTKKQTKNTKGKQTQEEEEEEEEEESDEEFPVEESETQKQDKKALASLSMQILPTLFQIYAVASRSQSEGIFEAISSYLRVTSPETLNQLFKTLMVEVVNRENETKVNFDTIYYVTLAVAFVPSLEKKNLDFLFKGILPSLKNSQNIKLKGKAWKVLSTIGIYHPNFLVEKYSQLSPLVSELKISNHANAASKRNQLRVYRCLVENLDDKQMLELVQTVLGEVILMTKDYSSLVRAETFKLIKALGERFKKSSQIVDLIQFCVAGLGGQRPEMISASLTTLSSLLFDHHTSINHDFLIRLLKPILELLGLESKEVVNACIKLISIIFFALTLEEQRPHLQPVVESLLGLNEKFKLHFRVPIRRILTKLIRRHSVAILAPFFPQADSKLLTSIRREELRKSKRHQGNQEVHVSEKSLESKKKSDKLSKKILSFEDVLGSDSDSESEIITPKDKKLKKPMASTWIIEDEDHPMDFLDQNALKNIISTLPSRHKIGFGKNDQIFKRTSEGKLIIEDEEHPLPPVLRKQLMMDDVIAPPQAMDLEEESKPMTKRRKKDAFEEQDDMENEKDQNEKKNGQKKSTSLVEIRQMRKLKQETGKKEKYSGEKFKAKKAGGDLKKGKIEPFAYIKLDPSALNRRSSHQSLERWKSVSSKNRKDIIDQKRKN